ncbi:hypothetical protein Tco_1549099 [Tanacetum coccineum]
MGVTLSGSQGLSSPQANGYVILSSCYGIHCCCWSAQVQVIAAVFVAVSILKLTLPTGRYVVPTGRYVVPAAYDISPGRVK